jgi:hypothetical protein
MLAKVSQNGRKKISSLLAALHTVSKVLLFVKNFASVI